MLADTFSYSAILGVAMIYSIFVLCMVSYFLIACFASNNLGLEGTPIALSAGDTARHIV